VALSRVRGFPGSFCKPASIVGKAAKKINARKPMMENLLRSWNIPGTKTVPFVLLFFSSRGKI
jgi:hypothetical protein